MRATRITCLSAALALALAACGERAGEKPPPPPDVPVADPELAVFEVVGFGEIAIALFSNVAPQTVEHFRKLAREGFYDGITFHRVKPGLLIQGGDPNSRDRDPRNDGQGGPGYAIPDEYNRVPQRRGVVSMAHRGRPNTAGTKPLKATPFLLIDD